ncbi:MAG TPA: electron transfer flavoprotein subunit alpha/FixB family protein [Dehalococcoidia bacterium]|nr:electron transfer flavoprotein subunit alpha/FixB family protein [Dehalococcoidia bacterium]
MSNSGEIWVIGEQRRGRLEEVSLELLSKGTALSQSMGVTLSAVLLGDEVEEVARELVFHGAEKIYLLEDARLRYYQSEAYARLLAGVIKEHEPQIVLIGATEIGKELAPRVAAKLRTGLTAYCIDLYVGEVGDAPHLIHVVPGWGGNLVMHIICPQRRPQVVTVKPGVLPKAVRDESRKGKIIKVRPDVRDKDFSRIETVEVVEESPKAKSVESADVVVCGGWGMNALGDFSKVQELADILGGVVAGTRPAMDKGWVDEARMIGQSGKTVSPGLFVSLGASGAMHYTTGFMGSKVVLAVDQNPQAPIFHVADVGIVGDLSEVIPCLIEELKKGA